MKDDREYEVIIAGGGPAGIGAALAAGLNGAKVLILESRSQFGGTATSALWMCINWLYRDNQNTDRGGVHKLLVEKILSYGSLASCYGKREGTINGGNLDVHPDYLKLAIFELFEEIGIDYKLYSSVTGASFIGHSAGKSMGNMIAVGQAAGVAAAISIKKDIFPDKLDVKEIQGVLINMGVDLFINQD